MLTSRKSFSLSSPALRVSKVKYDAQNCKHYRPPAIEKVRRA